MGSQSDLKSLYEYLADGSVCPHSSLSESHGLITRNRDTGNSYYLIARQYPSDDVEITALKLDTEDQLRKGGGAKRKSKDKTVMDESTLRKSQQRARIQVRRKLMSFDADRMLTLTFKENLTDIDDAWKVFKYFNKLMKFRYRDKWAYVAVPEFQKRGAVHFHLAVSGFYSVSTIRRLWLRACGQYLGNIDITSPRKFGKNSWNPKRLSNYLSKYMTKNESVDFNKKRYSSGGEIIVPPAVNGWIALGVSIVQIMRQVIESATRKSIRTVVEIENYYPINYLST